MLSVELSNYTVQNYSMKL